MSAPLPSIGHLGAALTAALSAHDRADELELGIRRDVALRVALDRIDALRGLISTMPAETLGDAAVQIEVAICHTCELANSVSSNANDLGHVIERLLLSVFPVVAAAAGLKLDGPHYDLLLGLRRHRFAELEAVR